MGVSGGESPEAAVARLRRKGLLPEVGAPVQCVGDIDLRFMERIARFAGGAAVSGDAPLLMEQFGIPHARVLLLGRVIAVDYPERFDTQGTRFTEADIGAHCAAQMFASALVLPDELPVLLSLPPAEAVGWIAAREAVVKRHPDRWTLTAESLPALWRGVPDGASVGWLCELAGIDAEEYLATQPRPTRARLEELAALRGSPPGRAPRLPRAPLDEHGFR